MIGRTISHYRIEAELGRGGMGVVYRAHDNRLGRDVALKVLPDEIANDAERRARLLNEARAAAALNHPGITMVYEVGEEGEQLFIVMELVAGKTLRAAISEGPTEPQALARLGAQAAEALSAAHAQGIVHGDVKPANIIVQPDGRVKLLDFGIARQAAAETVALTLTRSAAASARLPDAQIGGTLAYMAPEVLRGEPADARADLFSLGIVLYELAAGRRPFPGPTATAVTSQILNGAPPTLSDIATGVPTELARIVHKLLEKPPDSRYQSAREVQVDLTNLARNLQLGAVLPAAAAGKRAVAVLPFKLLTPNPEDEYLSVALADAVIGQLSSSGEFLVRPTSTVMRYVKQPVDPLLAARELNVQSIVDGSIQKFAAKLRVQVQLWNPADGSALLSAKHDSDITDLFGLQDRIAEGVSRGLGLKPVAEQTPAAPPTKHTVAYELFMRAAERLSRLNKWDLHTAIEMLETVTSLDPRFAEAWARLAGACVNMAGQFEPGPKWIHRAERATRRALALHRENADAQCARGRILWTPAKRFQNRAAARALSHALRLNPGCHEARLWQCLILNHVGLFEEAKEGLASALATNPDDVYVLAILAQTAHYIGKAEEAEEYYARALAIDPGHVWPNNFVATAVLYSDKPERAAEKIRIAERAVPGEPLLASCEAVLWALRGENRKAEQWIRRALKAKSLFHTHHTWHYSAAAYATMGKPAQAVALLRKAANWGLPNYPAFRDDRYLASLHKYPPFLRLMADLKQEWSGYQREFGRR